MRALEAEDLRKVAELVSTLTSRPAQEVVDELAFDLDTGDADEPHSSLINGLTSLRRAQWDIEALLRETGPADPNWRKAHLLVLGLLFEVGVKCDDWVAARARRLLEHKGQDPVPVLRANKELKALYGEYNPALGLVRDRVFHTRPWHEDEIVGTLARALYARDVPAKLLRAIDGYGRTTVTELCRRGIGIPGIGCFNIICR